MSLRQLKTLALASKKLYSLKLYQFITNLLFLANKPTLGQVAKKFKSKLRRMLDPVTFLVGQLALGSDIYLCNITYAQKYMLTKHRKTILPQTALTGGTGIILPQCFFSFKIRQQDFIVQKSKRSLIEVYCSFHPEVRTSTFPSQASKISDQTLVMLTEVLRLQSFFFCICKYVMYVVLCMQLQSHNCIYETYRCLLILTVKIVTTNK